MGDFTLWVGHIFFWGLNNGAGLKTLGVETFYTVLPHEIFWVYRTRTIFRGGDL